MYCYMWKPFIKQDRSPNSYFWRIKDRMNDRGETPGFATRTVLLSPVLSLYYQYCYYYQYYQQREREPLVVSPPPALTSSCCTGITTSPTGRECFIIFSIVLVWQTGVGYFTTSHFWERGLRTTCHRILLSQKPSILGVFNFL